MPNQIKNKKNYQESAKEYKSSKKSDTSFQKSSKSLHDNHHEGLSLATSNSQSNLFNPMINLFSLAYRQQGIHNNPLGVAMLGERKKIFIRDFLYRKTLF